MKDKKRVRLDNAVLNIRKRDKTIYFEDKFPQFLPISEYNNNKIIIKENEIGMMYNCSVIFNPEYED